MRPTRASVTTAGAIGLLGLAMSVTASTNVDPVNKWSWGENIGFMNWADANGGVDGVEVLTDHLRGFIWCENVGWVNTGNGGGPYANIDNTNFGVNILGTGFTDGFAWGENIGWVNFGTQPTIGVDGARFDFAQQRFFGWAWGENVGWINLDDANIFVSATPAPVCCLGNAQKIPNNTIDFDDVIAVLGAWDPTGATTNPNGTGAGDADCDGDVDFDDVIAVLANSGLVCP